MKRQYEIAVLSKGGYARTVRIYAPKKADRAIIMHDGQNVFYDEDATFKKSWRAIATLNSLNIKNTAIIGIDSVASRLNDYIPFPNELAEYGEQPYGGNADSYMEYLESMVIPYLDKRFGYKFYGMLGSSAGAIATMYFAARKNQRLKAYGMFSAPLFVCPKAFEKFFDEASFDPDAFYQIFAGGSERTKDFSGTELEGKEQQFFVDSAFKITNELRKSNVTALRLSMNNTAVHDELSWLEPESEFFAKFALL